MVRTSRLLLLLCLAYNSVFCYYSSDDDGSSIFTSIRRADYSTLKSYHFSKLSEYEPVNEPIMYTDGDNANMIIGFNNMLIFAKFENEKHYVIRVSEDLDEDTTTVPREFLNANDNGELFNVVTLKPTITTTTTSTTTSTTSATSRYMPFRPFRDMVKDIQREALPGFDPDSQSLSSYLQQVSLNMSRLAQTVSDGD